MAGIRPIYTPDILALSNDPTATAQNTNLVATNYIYLGSSSWTILIPNSLSAFGTLNVQANNSNYITDAVSGNVKWTTNALLNQPTEGNKSKYSVNPSFSANWVTIDTLTSGMVYRNYADFPIRYLRLSGAGLTAAGFNAFVWTADMTSGV